MARGESDGYRTAHRDSRDMDGSANLERVQQAGELFVIEVAVIGGVRAVGPAASEQVVAKYLESSVSECIIGGIPDVVRCGESGDQHHCAAARSAFQLVMR